MSIHKLRGGIERAPRPTRASIQRAIYDAVESLGGDGGTDKEIRKLLPATDDAERLILRRKKLDRALYMSQYAGYIVHNPRNNTYKIAPLEYYTARQKVVEDHQRHFKSKRLRPRLVKVAVSAVVDRKLLFAVAWISFFVGLLCGYAL